MSVDATIDVVYYAVENTNGTLFKGKNSRSNGLYESRARALAPVKRELKSIERSIRRNDANIELIDRDTYYNQEELTQSLVRRRRFVEVNVYNLQRKTTLENLEVVKVKVVKV